MSRFERGIRSWSRTLAGLLALAAAAATVPARAADHRDGPRVLTDLSVRGAIDLNDLYLFVSPANKNNTVLFLSTGSAGVGVVTPPYFFPGCIYEFRISNDGNHLTDELIFQFVFSNPDAFLRQSYVMYAVNGVTGQSSVAATGVTGKNAAIRGGGLVRAGIYDDPFFFDVLAFNKFRDQVGIGAPLGDRVAPFLAPNIPNNFFGNFNVLGIVVEVPRVRLQSTHNNPNIAVWIRVLLPNGVQYDRMGRPAINTAVGFGAPAFNKSNVQDFFNSITPVQDLTLRSEAADRINLYFGLPPAQARNVSNMLLPDVLTFNTTDTSGYLNGRRLADDVIDISLNLLTGGALKGDRVINDSIFSKTFPYVGPPLPRSANSAAAKAMMKIGGQ
ncbi:MAG: DUF4331 family protein [Isosphaeraceae bacterium]